MASNLIESKQLQIFFDNTDHAAVREEADLVIELDVFDGDADSVGDQLHGVEQGIELASRLAAVRKIKGNENAQIHKLTYPDHGGVDAIMLFVGTEGGLTNMFKLNPADV